MEKEEMVFSNQEVLSGTDIGNDLPDLPSRFFMGNFFDELLKDTHACTHIHTCNPPGPDNTHTHTCIHTHTKLVLASEEKSVDMPELVQKKCSKLKKPTLGNREAVKKYREKKKARTACLEEQVLHLTALNQKLMKKLQSQAALEVEITRLRCLLSTFRGRIDVELGSYPYQKLNQTDKQRDDFLQSVPGRYILNSCNVPCSADVPCLHPTLASQSEWYGATCKCKNPEVDVDASKRLDLFTEGNLSTVAPTVISPRRQENQTQSLSQLK
eukprot:Gb_00618 [translate_table: standard]